MSDFTDMLFGAGQSALAGGAGAVLGLGLQGWQNQQQLDQQQKLNDMNFNQAVKLGMFNQQQQMDLWNKTNYSAQVDQLNKAGLNPALLYAKGSGPGGVTAANPGTPGNSQAQQQNASSGMALQMMNMQLMEAQKRNIDADTANKQAQTANAPLQGQQIQAQTASLTQGVENQKAVEALTRVQTQISALDAKLKASTLEEQEGIIVNTMNLVSAQIENIGYQNNIMNDTWKLKVQQAQQEVIQTAAQNQLIKAQTNLTDAQRQNIAQQIAVQWGTLHNSQDQTKIQQELADFQKSFGNQAGQILGHLLQIIPK